MKCVRSRAAQRRLLGPAGQEFVPQRSWLNVVEMWISHGFVGTEPPTDVFVRVREAAIDVPAANGTSGAIKDLYR